MVVWTRQQHFSFLSKMFLLFSFLGIDIGIIPLSLSKGIVVSCSIFFTVLILIGYFFVLTVIDAMSIN